MTGTTDEITLRKAAERGALGRCPCCGKGELFARYLRQVENCANCGEAFGALRADDAAPWLTIIVLGHFILPLAFLIDLESMMPRWLALTSWSLLFTLVALVMLPRSKGIMLGVLWQTKATGEPTIVK